MALLLPTHVFPAQGRARTIGNLQQLNSPRTNKR
jgi:hypothetical protein